MRRKLSAGIPLHCVLLHCILFAGPSSAATIHVDGSNPNCPGNGSPANPFCLIQDAIAAASSGDTVLVVAGTYTENLDFLGKPIMVIGVSGPAVTLIQAGAPGSVVRFDSGESINSVLQGFTISGGSGTVVSWGAGTAPVGGGIFCRLSSPTIRNNVIENNSGALHGGGIFCEGGAPTIEGNVIRGHNTESGGGIALRLSCGALIEANEITGNTAGAACGGGILVMSESNPKIRNNTLSGNTGTCGGGIASEDAAPLIHDNRIANNLADDGEGGGISCRGSTADIWRNEITGNGAVDGGGGIAFWNGDVTVAENLIQGNLASASGNGGGLLGTVALAVIRDNLVEANDTRNIGGGMFLLGAAHVLGNTVRGNLTRSGIACFQGAPEIVDNLIIDNEGDGIECVGASVSPILRRNTIVGNQYGAVFVDLGASVSINSSILYGNGSGPGSEIFVASGSASVDWSNVRGGYPGTGNIDSDPQFSNPALNDYSLALSSPCVDAGDPADLDCGTGFGGEPRRLDGRLDGTREVDMGARERGNIRLDLTVNPVVPTITVDVSGTSGLSVLLFGSLRQGQLCSRFGVFLLDAGPGMFLVPWGTVPSSVMLYPQPQALQTETHWQLLGLGAGSVGNFSNQVTIGGG